MPNNDWQDEAGWQDEPPQSSAPQPAPMSAPKLGDFIPDADTMGKAASGIASGIGGMASSLGSGAVGMVTHPLDTMAGALKSAGKSITDSYDLAKQGQIVPAAARAMSLVGFDEPKLAQEWNQGQGAHAVGEALPMSITDAMGAEKMAGRDLELPQMEKPQMPNVPSASGLRSRFSIDKNYKIPGTPIKVNLGEQPSPVTAAREGAMNGLLRQAAREELRPPKPSITAAPSAPAVAEEPIAHWQEGEAPQTRGSQAWSKQRVQSPELQRAAAAGDTDAQTVMMRLGKKGIIIPKPSIGSK